ncbi:LysR family transcriptional regulator [Enterobacillus tribolii]|uniref:LysR family transcriptional regulator n=1 Tax=Enterobacillus tribolii TaxID=1487935 RepID=A0A370QHF5_9GAMM|nr:LysR family transcriptional regulator [Enterobacillus tribolii]MBW7982508.1 LysR family transcriptional regulator [Enterobacillus tribolii]RDK87786.1 LysR family transcriptional regulator [Enterobacillus tribolii]
MDKISAMQIFVSVAELSSFSRTAEVMGLPKGSVSGAVSQLENQMGTRLLQRTTRRVALTQDGQICYERCKSLLADMDELEGMFRANDMPVSGRLRVDMPGSFSRNLVVSALPAFLAAHPALELELSSSDRRVDLIHEGFDCVVRVGVLQDSGLIARPLGMLNMVNCASRDYLARHGVPQTPADLSAHRLVHYMNAQGAADRFEYLEDGGVKSVGVPGALAVNNTETYTAACLAGLGIIQVPLSGVKEYLAEGRLVEILPGYPPPPMPVSLVYPHRRNLAKRVQVFMEWITALVKQNYVTTQA